MIQLDQLFFKWNKVLRPFCCIFMSKNLATKRSIANQRLKMEHLTPFERPISCQKNELYLPWNESESGSFLPWSTTSVRTKCNWTSGCAMSLPLKILQKNDQNKKELKEFRNSENFPARDRKNAPVWKLLLAQIPFRVRNHWAPILAILCHFWDE